MDYTFRHAVDAWYVEHYGLGEAYVYLFRKVFDEYAPQNLSDKDYRLFRRYQDENGACCLSGYPGGYWGYRTFRW